MKAKSSKWLAFSKLFMNFTLVSDACVTNEQIDSTLQLHIESCHEDDIVILPDLSTLRPSDIFADKMLPLTSYNDYHEALAFFKELSNHLHFLLENTSFQLKLQLYVNASSSSNQVECMV